MTLAERPIQSAARWSKDPVEPMPAPAMSDRSRSEPPFTVLGARRHGCDPRGRHRPRRASRSRRCTPSREASRSSSSPAPRTTRSTAVQIAAQAYEVLRRHGRELRFQTDDGIMRIEVYDGMGRLVRTIPPNEALALAAGEASWQA